MDNLAVIVGNADKKVTSIVDEIENAFFDIPFENSAFQDKYFVLAAQITPARAYRALGLRMSAKIRALKEARYSLQLDDIEIEELRHKISLPATSDFDRRRHEVEINKRMDSRSWTAKLVNDAIVELEYLHAEFKKFPRYTREEFEKEEMSHFAARLSRQANGVEGASESLHNMAMDALMMEKMISGEIALDGEQHIAQMRNAMLADATRQTQASKAGGIDMAGTLQPSERLRAA